MNAQLYQVLRTYVRRPLLLMMGAVALLFAVGQFFLGLYANSSGELIAPGFPSSGRIAAVSSNDWTTSLGGRRPSEIDRLRVTNLSGEPPVDLTLFEHATTIQLTSSDLNAEQITQLKSLGQLHNLAIQAPSLPTGIWSALGPKLQSLEIPARLLVEHPQEVSQLTQLKVLRIDRSSLTQETMSVIAKIPNLKYLVLSLRVVDYKAPQDAPPTPPLVWDPTQLTPLQNHPHLQAIFADYLPSAQRTTPVLPGVTIYAASASYSQSHVLQLSLFFTTIISLMVAFQAWAHFSTQHSVIIPGYHRPHIWAALLVLLGGSAVAALLLWNARISLLPAMAVALAAPAIVMAMLVESQSQAKWVRLVCVPLGLLAGASFIWIPGFGRYASPTVAGEINWFFQGQLWWWAIGLLAVEAILLTASLYYLPRIVHLVYEQSSLHPGFSPWDPQQQRRTAYGSQQWWQSLWDRSQRFPQLAGSSVWRQAQLWQAGNAYRPLFVLPLMGAVFLMMVIGMPLVMGPSQHASSLLIGCLFQFGMITLLLPVNVWYRRCRSLQVESLRPAGKQDLTRQLFVALAFDQSWAIIPVLLGIGCLLYFPQQVGTTTMTAAIAPMLVAALVWGYAISTSIFAIRRMWVLVGYFLAMTVIPFVLGLSIAFLLATQYIPRSQQIPLLCLVAFAALAVSVGIVLATYTRALNREWG